jgi:hypothetical protein
MNVLTKIAQNDINERTFKKLKITIKGAQSNIFHSLALG